MVSLKKINLLIHTIFQKKNKMLKKNILKILIPISTIIIIINFYYFVSEKSLNQYADWLINYQGGFVRRGLIGEFFFQIYKYFNIRIDVLIFLFVSLFYILFSFNFFKILKDIKLNFLNLLIIFSPFSFLYPVMDQKASGRKDIFFLLLLSFLCLYLRKIKFKYQKYLIIFFSILSILTHTGFLFLVPMFIMLFIILNNKELFKSLFIELIYIVVSILVVIFFIYNHTSISSSNIELICNSIKDYVRPDCNSVGYISTLDWSLKLNLELKKKLWMTQNYNLFYFKYFLITFAPILFALYFSKFNKKKINTLVVFLFTLISVFPLFYIGVDYGRYLYISYLSIIMIYFVSINNNYLITNIPQFNFFDKLKLKSTVIFLIIFIYGFTFTIPHCCDNKLKFVYSKILTKTLEKINYN